MQPTNVELITRNGNDWTSKFRVVADAVKELGVHSAILDGEVVALAGNGTTNFQMLQNSLSSGRAGELVYYAFDLLYLNGYDLRRSPLLERKRVLESLLASAPNNTLRYSEHYDTSGLEVFDKACSLSLEGIISKRKNAGYEEGRAQSWVKTKCVKRQEFVIGGWTNPEGGRSGFGALLVGVRDRGELKFAGKVGTGFTNQSLRELKTKLDKLAADTTPFSNPPRERGLHWVRPELVGEIEFTEWTEDGKLRHPSFQGLREDKSAKEVVAEKPVSVEAVEKEASAGKPATARKKAANPNDARVLGVRISNPGKIIYQQQGITKLQLAQYYEAIGKYMLPHVKNRPLSLVRCPEGEGKECFYQKHESQGMGPEIGRVNVSEKEKSEIYLQITGLKSILALVQFGVLEFHTWGSVSQKLENPDIIVFDLDPDESVPWSKMIDTAKLLRDRLKALGLVPFLKTTGGKGLHIVVPIKPQHTWDEVYDFTQAFANLIVRENPKLYLAKMSKAARKGKIFIDYMRNGRGATFIAPFSTRARKGAPIAVPIGWDELTEKLRPNQFSLGEVVERMTHLKKDPWQDFTKSRRPLPLGGA